MGTVTDKRVNLGIGVRRSVLRVNLKGTVVSTESDREVIFCLHIKLYIPLQLMRIDRSLVC